MHSLELVDIRIEYSFEIWLNELIIILIDVFDMDNEDRDFKIFGKMGMLKNSRKIF